MSHLAPSYQILWLSKDKSFWKLALFWYHFITAKVFFMAYHMQSMQSMKVKTFSFGRIC